MAKPRALILRAAGTNCDAETAYAFERAGAQPVLVHVNQLLAQPRTLDEAQILAIPGGFSYGDDIAAGRILANQLMHHLRSPLEDFVAAGKPIIGICNGFQVLIKTHLLPGPMNGRSGQTCTLTNNTNGRFVDRWIHLRAHGQKCIWTAGIETIDLPVAHGEGRFVHADERVRELLWSNEHVALTYAKSDGSPAELHFPDNPNGSTDDIAAICDATGLVFGLMPHPERYMHASQNPAGEGARGPAELGLRIFLNAVNHVEAAAIAR
jgi:phosphoribosylformylglycinamidine synthase